MKKSATLASLGLAIALPAALCWYYDVYVHWQPKVFPFAVAAAILGNLLLTLLTLNARGEKRMALVWRAALSTVAFTAALIGVSGVVNNAIYGGRSPGPRLAAYTSLALVSVQLAVLFVLLLRALHRPKLTAGLAVDAPLSALLCVSILFGLPHYAMKLLRPGPTGEPPELKLGAYYWDGWYEKIPHWTDSLLNEFSGREPTWGWLSAGVENMEMQIDLAADHGLDFFAFDWYYPESGEINPMNYAVDRFLASGNNERMEFCLLVANHAGFRIYQNTWPDAVERFLPYLSSERALRVDGKPVIIFFANGESDLGGTRNLKKSLDYLRAECVKAGLKGAYIMVCAGPERDTSGDISTSFTQWAASARKYKAMGYDAVTAYNYSRGSLPDGTYEYPFRQLSADYEQVWAMQAKYSLLPYMPALNGGWDCRPWQTPSEGWNPAGLSCYSPDRKPEDFYDHVRNVKQWLADYPNAGVDGLAIFYAWNELGEGGYLVPTKGEGDAVLKAIREAVDGR